MFNKQFHVVNISAINMKPYLRLQVQRSDMF